MNTDEIAQLILTYLNKESSSSANDNLCQTLLMVIIQIDLHPETPFRCEAGKWTVEEAVIEKNWI